MGDVADILGIKVKNQSDDVSRILYDKPKALSGGQSLKKKKPIGMSKEVFDLIGADGLQSSIQPMKINAGFKSKRLSAFNGKWVWAPFRCMEYEITHKVSPSMYHWVKADAQLSEYAYSKFNVKFNMLMYTDDEYESMFGVDGWNRRETDHLMELCQQFDLRWPVIVDRYSMNPPRRTEDLQFRYYSIVAKLRQSRNLPNEFANRQGDDNPVFNLEMERNRRMQQDALYRRNRAEDVEELQLREEMKSIDMMLKKSRKHTKSQLAAAAASLALAATSSATATGAMMSGAGGSADGALSYSQASASSAGSTAGAAAYASATTASLRPSAAVAHPYDPATAPQLQQQSLPGKPCLQSKRLYMSEQALGLSKNLTKKFNTLMRDWGAPEAPLPTRAVCDLYDQVRRDSVNLLSLQTLLQKKEKELTSLATQLLTQRNRDSQSHYLAHGAHSHDEDHMPEAPPVSKRKAAASAKSSAASSMGQGQGQQPVSGGDDTSLTSKPVKRIKKEKQTSANSGNMLMHISQNMNALLQPTY